VEIDRTSVGSLFSVYGEPYVGAMVYHGVDPNRSLYVASLDDVLKGAPRWRKLFDKTDRVEGGGIAKGWLYLKTSKDAPRYKVVRVPFRRTTSRRPRW
jgi:hypothetical protein